MYPQFRRRKSILMKQDISLNIFLYTSDSEKKLLYFSIRKTQQTLFLLKSMIDLSIELMLLFLVRITKNNVTQSLQMKKFHKSTIKHLLGIFCL